MNKKEKKEQQVVVLKLKKVINVPQGIEVPKTMMIMNE